MIDINSGYQDILNIITEQMPFEPETCIVLGSGLGDFADKVETLKSIATSSLPGYPASTVQGHQGYLHFSRYKGKRLLVVQGRIHPYEGYTLSQCILPVYIAVKINCKNILLTNAAGGINTNFTPGDLMLAVKLNGSNLKKELEEIIDPENRKTEDWYIPATSEKMNEKIRLAASEEKINLQEGLYWYTKGPSYETKAEIRMIGSFGGDAVGMSTVHEAIYSSAKGLNTASISCVTNFAAGLSPQKLTHTEVMETAEKAKNNFERLVKKSIELF